MSDAAEERARSALRFPRPCKCFEADTTNPLPQCQNGLCRDAVLSIANAIREAVAEKDKELTDHIHGLQATLVACEQACWKEGQTLNGLNRDIRRAAAMFCAGKNSIHDAVTIALAEENERCAKVAESLAAAWLMDNPGIVNHHKRVAEAIRARDQEG